MNITFGLKSEEKYFAITLSPSRESFYIFICLRKDIWKKSEVQSIINALNLVKIPVNSTDDYLKDEYSKVVDKELQNGMQNYKIRTLSPDC